MISEFFEFFIMGLFIAYAVLFVKELNVNFTEFTQNKIFLTNLLRNSNLPNLITRYSDLCTFKNKNTHSNKIYIMTPQNKYSIRNHIQKLHSNTCVHIWHFEEDFVGELSRFKIHLSTIDNVRDILFYDIEDYFQFHEKWRKNIITNSEILRPFLMLLSRYVVKNPSQLIFDCFKLKDKLNV